MSETDCQSDQRKNVTGGAATRYDPLQRHAPVDSGLGNQSTSAMYPLLRDDPKIVKA